MYSLNFVLQNRLQEMIIQRRPWRRYLRFLCCCFCVLRLIKVPIYSSFVLKALLFFSFHIYFRAVINHNGQNKMASLVLQNSLTTLHKSTPTPWEWWIIYSMVVSLQVLNLVKLINLYLSSDNIRENNLCANKTSTSTSINKLPNSSSCKHPVQNCRFSHVELASASWF